MAKKKRELKQELKQEAQEIVENLKENLDEKNVKIENIEEVINELEKTKAELQSTKDDYIKALEDSDRKNKLLFENSSSLICELDQEGTCKTVNPSYTKTLGYAYKDLVGFKFVDFVHPDDLPDVLQGYEEVFKTNKNAIKQWRIKHKNGDWRTFNCNSAVSINSKGEKSLIIVSEDITDKILSEEELKKSMYMYETLANNIPNTDIYIYDKNLRFLLVVGKEMQKYGFSREHFEGRTIHEVLDERTRKKLLPLYQDAINGRKVEKELEYAGEYYYTEAIPLRNEKGEVYAGMIISFNISQDKAKEDELRRAKELAESANRTKSEFMANMSHEIRTPLNSIIGFTEQLVKTKLDIEQDKFVSLINESSEHLISVVNEILTLFKLGTGTVHIDKIPFNIISVFTDVFNSFKIRANKKNLGFEYLVNENVPPVLMGDPFRLKQILINLISNAIKFTHLGYVKFTAEVQKQTKKRVTIRISVRDTGIGIDKAELDTVFQEFKQADSSITRKYGGSGLGLTIVKKMVELQGGSISLKSALKEGSEFVIQMPYAIGKKDDIVKEERLFSLNTELIQDKTILLVDDDDTNRLLGGTILKNWKIKYDEARNGEEALQLLKSKKYDLVLLDIQMPKLSGIDVTRIIRSEKGSLNHSTKIMAVTANVIKQDINNYLKSGMDNFLIKPFKEEELFNKICNVLNIQDSSATDSNRLEIDRTILDSEKTNSKAYDLNELIKTAKGDIQFYNETLESYINTLQHTKNNLGKNLKEENWTMVGKLAHKLISSSRFLGLSDIVNACMQIEDNTLRAKNYNVIPEIANNLTKKISNLIPQLKKEIIKKDT